MRLRFTALCASALLVAGASCARTEPRVGPRLPVRITVVGLNDFHGALEERTVLLKTSGGTTATVRAGGGALLASYVEKIEKSNPAGTIILSAGDMWQGSLESNYFEGRPVALLDNHIGVDAAALGNHEFDYGPAGPLSLADPKDPPAHRYGALEARRKDMEFPLLAANVRATEPGVPEFQGWVMMERKGVKIAVIGLATEDTPNVTQRPNVAGLAFDPPAEALRKAAEEARSQGAQIVVGVGHLGGNCKRETSPDDAAACKESEEVVHVLRAVPAGTVDAFVAGHTHQYMSHFVNGVPVIESGAYGAAIGRVDLEYDLEKKRLVRTTIAPPQPVCREVLADTGECSPPAEASEARPLVVPASFLGATIEPSAEVQQLLAPFRQEVSEMKAEILASAARDLAVKRYEQSDVGALVTDEMIAATRRHDDLPDADFALQNSGGLRKAIPKGEISYGALYEVLPFDNLLVTLSLTGEQIDRLLTGVVRTGRIFQTSGLLVELTCDKSGKPDGARAKDLATGRRLSPTKKYTLVWNDFLANGGDGTKEVLAGVEQTFHAQYLLRDVIAEGLRTRKKAINSAKEPVLDPKRPRLETCR